MGAKSLYLPGPLPEHQGPALQQSFSRGTWAKLTKAEKLGATAQVKRETGPHGEGCKRLLSGGVCLPGGEGCHLPESTAQEGGKEGNRTVKLGSFCQGSSRAERASAVAETTPVRKSSGTRDTSPHRTKGFFIPQARRTFRTKVNK